VTRRVRDLQPIETVCNSWKLKIGCDAGMGVELLLFGCA